MPNEQPLPEVVYHYTSMDTLLKIVETRSIWATNINYLNDVLERKHCLASVRSRLSSADGKTSFGPIEEDQGEKEERDSIRSLPFVASFSGARDSLTQWRSYCPQGNGVCIGFRTESLNNAFLIPSRSEPGDEIWIEFGAVIYLDPSDTFAVDTMIRQALNKATESKAAHPDYTEVGFSRDLWFWSAIDEFASRTKHISFAAEREFRLVVGGESGTLGMRYRTSRSTLVPFVLMGLPDPNGFLVWHPTPRFQIPDLPQPYFIDNVTIGPTPHPELSMDSLRSLFEDANRNVLVHSSEVPYRDW
jgi:hypothetical protein